MQNRLFAQLNLIGPTPTPQDPSRVPRGLPRGPPKTFSTTRCGDTEALQRSPKNQSPTHGCALGIWGYGWVPGGSLKGIARGTLGGHPCCYLAANCVPRRCEKPQADTRGRRDQRVCRRIRQVTDVMWFNIGGESHTGYRATRATRMAPGV